MSARATHDGLSARRRGTDLAMRALILFAVLLALTPLVWILFDVVKMGIHAIRGASFFTQGPPGDPSERGGGVYNGILGTFVMLGVASLIAIPLGLLGAVYLVEFGAGGRFARTVRFFGDVMTGIPSIVFGIFVYTLVVASTHQFSAFAGALAIGFIMWPIVMRTSEEMLRLVPRELREAAYALGVPRWRTILRVVLPTAASGLVTGIMLGVARAAGETAPLLFTALGNQFVSAKLSRPISALPLEIFRGATTAFAAANERAWAAALTLIVFVLLLTVGSRALVRRRVTA
jgi:phosphate transport system permease protein